jgi:hypothetical protein
MAKCACLPRLGGETREVRLRRVIRVCDGIGRSKRTELESELHLAGI